MAWKDHWPTFHLEVKTTSGVRAAPFHMSQAQVEHALHLTRDSTSAPPKELYAIIRVSNIRNSPEYIIYPDPHKLFHEGDLRIASDVEITLGV